ncbi:kynureninase [Inhella gelatinilytica]|uniref:Kynureninase n=1 Tax=Inhella gelatinilytica TaxID=2795030 RepID=A0A931IWC6_9BURK|nr:kynureninase [Inhella gelatinilytica]MBH9552776.1 kynureninase [Inhella gelatinilytica]
MTRDDALQLDAQDPLAPLHELFQLPEGKIYLDGNSLGALPKATAERVRRAIEQEWGSDLIESWNKAGWIDAPRRLGDKLAPLVGARTGEVLVADSTSINLYKVLHAALSLQQGQRKKVVSERSNFPTDLYIADSVVRAHGGELVLVDTPDEIPAHLDERCAVLMLTHVHYRTGRMHDMALLTRWAQQAGALTIWDLAHSAGAVPVDLLGSAADFAVGCGYKYLNGGPGAPAFVWVHPRHHGLSYQPLSGWLGHAQPFAFSPFYQPAAGIQQYQCGTPAVLAMTALESGLEVFEQAQKLGGMAALRSKSLALTQLFMDEVEARVPQARIVTPKESAQRGSQVSLALNGDLSGAAYAVMQALIARGVVGDFRAGDPRRLEAEPHLLRFGFTPLYTRFADAFDAVTQLADILATEAWRAPEFQKQNKVT